MDHLVFGVPDLAQGIELVASRTGVRPSFGGQHPGRGTHNALLSLGGWQYLEIIAMDPEQTNAPGLLFAELATLSQPRIIGWADAVDSVEDVAARARTAGIATVGPLAGARSQTDGTLLTWKTLRLANPPLEGMPFFIEWQPGTVHPSQSTPSGCQLASFEIEHPDADAMLRALRSLGVEAIVSRGAQVRLKARLQTPKGDVELG